MAWGRFRTLEFTGLFCFVLKSLRPCGMYSMILFLPTSLPQQILLRYSAVYVLSVIMLDNNSESGLVCFQKQGLATYLLVVCVCGNKCRLTCMNPLPWLRQNRTPSHFVLQVFCLLRFFCLWVECLDYRCSCCAFDSSSGLHNSFTHQIISSPMLVTFSKAFWKV